MEQMIPWIYSTDSAVAHYFARVMERELPGITVFHLADSKSLNAILPARKQLIIVHDKWNFCNEINPEAVQDIAGILKRIRNGPEANRQTPILLTHLGITDYNTKLAYAHAGLTHMADLYNSKDALGEFTDNVWNALMGKRINHIAASS